LLPEALPQGSDLPSEELLRRRVLHALLPAVRSGHVLPEGLCSGHVLDLRARDLLPEALPQGALLHTVLHAVRSGHVLPEGLCSGHVLLALRALHLLCEALP
jgi:hypothetical protein